MCEKEALCPFPDFSLSYLTSHIFDRKKGVEFQNPMHGTTQMNNKLKHFELNKRWYALIDCNLMIFFHTLNRLICLLNMRYVRKMKIDKFKLTSEIVMLLLSAFAHKGDFFSLILQSKNTNKIELRQEYIFLVMAHTFLVKRKPCWWVAYSITLISYNHDK